MAVKAVVLLSGGLDSALNLLRAKEEFKEVLALTFNYGQRAWASEFKSSQKIVSFLKVPHKTVELTFFKEFTKTSLVDRDNELPTKSVDIESLEASQKSAEKVWVPNRNGIFLNVAAGFAEGLGADYIIPGFNVEEAETFPDNSEDFCKSMDRALSFSTKNQTQVKCYTLGMDKKEIVKELKSKDFSFSWLWPCYRSQEKWCGECESCQRFARALKFNQLSFEAYNENKVD